MPDEYEDHPGSSRRPVADLGGPMLKPLSAVFATVALTVASVAVASPAGAATSSIDSALAATSGAGICYQAHVQNEGWQTPRCNGEIAGTEGKNQHLEKLLIAKVGTGRLCARAHVQNLGWPDKWQCADDNQTIALGTEGLGLQIEAIEITVSTGVAIDGHIENHGWTGWSGYHTGVGVGTVGQNRAIEAVKLAVR
ncbi:hypothetical protein AB0D94_30545 [Streptomyces sp. NPDC048255]|uniref:hypothetical protein n=1 Tax=Streptomyces sp. NPDC048255 TaxID=3154713 RepID=UPI00340E3547